MNIKSCKINIPNVEIIIEKEDIIVNFKNSLECLSNATINGGCVKYNSIVNHHVPLNFEHSNPNEKLEPFKNKFNLCHSMISLFTAIDVKETVLINKEIDDVDNTIILTAGLTNTSSTIIEDLNLNESINNKPGTINIILLLNVKLTEHAVFNSFIIITEVKTLLLNKFKVCTKDRRLATGNSTCTTVVCSTNKGQLIECPGYATIFGQSIGQTHLKKL